jgi:hypothetical protein
MCCRGKDPHRQLTLIRYCVSGYKLGHLIPIREDGAIKARAPPPTRAPPSARPPLPAPPEVRSPGQNENPQPVRPPVLEFQPPPPPVDYFSAFNSTQMDLTLADDREELDRIVSREEGSLDTHSYQREYVDSVLLKVKNFQMNVSSGNFWVYPKGMGFRSTG